MKGTIGKLVWNITKYDLKFTAAKAKNCNFDTSGIVNIHMVCLQDAEIWISFSNTS